MRAFVLSTARQLAIAAVAVSTIVPVCAASGAVMTVGGPLAILCYRSATSSDGRSFAVDVCTRALQEEALAVPDRAATYVNRGIVYMSAGHFDEADADFDAALKIRDGLPDAWLNKGFLRIRQGHGRQALPLLQKGIDAGASRQALAIFARGVAYEQIGDYRSAYADLRRAQQLDPGWSLPRQYLAEYKASRGN